MLLDLVENFQEDLPRSIPILYQPNPPPVLKYPGKIFELLITGGFINALEDLYNLSAIPILVRAWLKRQSSITEQPKKPNIFVDCLRFLTRSDPFYATAKALLDFQEPAIKVEGATARKVREETAQFR